jgi:phosphate transport system permease protein
LSRANILYQFLARIVPLTGLGGAQVPHRQYRNLRSTLDGLSLGDRILFLPLFGIAVVVGTILVLIVGFTLSESLPALEKIGIADFFRGTWHPTTGHYNLLPMVLGSIFVTAGAMVFATPLGIASALFCEFYASRPIALIYRRMLELFAGIPSVVYGFWGLVVLVPIIARIHPPGPSAIAGMFVVGLMILPTIALVTQASLATLPTHYWRSSMALGVERWPTIRRVCLPAARAGIATALVLAVGRAIGETMAVLMICGNAIQVPDSVFDSVRTLTANIALEMAYALDVHRSALFVSGLLLVAIISLGLVLCQNNIDG